MTQMINRSEESNYFPKQGKPEFYESPVEAGQPPAPGRRPEAQVKPAGKDAKTSPSPRR
jgi:hypothetical protein